jgi:hypothetical protein
MQAMVGFWVCWLKLVASWRQILNRGLLNVGAVGGLWFKERTTECSGAAI